MSGSTSSLTATGRSADVGVFLLTERLPVLHAAEHGDRHFNRGSQFEQRQQCLFSPGELPAKG